MTEEMAPLDIPQPRAPLASGPRIPAPPPGRQGKKKGDGRFVIWFAMLVLGAIVGVAFHRFLPFVNIAFDEWVVGALR